MTTEATPETTTAAPAPAATEPAKAAPPPEPMIDVEDLERRASERAEEIADKKIKQAFRQLAGETEEKPKAHPKLMQFAADPDSVLQETVKEAVRATRAELDGERQLAQAAEPLMRKYPGLQEHLDYADAKITKLLRDGKSIQEATKEGLEDAAKKLKLKSVDEIEQDNRVKGATLPFGGSYSGPAGKAAAFDPNKSASDYITNLKAKHKSFRVSKQ